MCFPRRLCVLSLTSSYRVSSCLIVSYHVLSCLVLSLALSHLVSFCLLFSSSPRCARYPFPPPPACVAASTGRVMAGGERPPGCPVAAAGVREQGRRPTGPRETALQHEQSQPRREQHRPAVRYGHHGKLAREEIGLPYAYLSLCIMTRDVLAPRMKAILSSNLTPSIIVELGGGFFVVRPSPPEFM